MASGVNVVFPRAVIASVNSKTFHRPGKTTDGVEVGVALRKDAIEAEVGRPASDLRLVAHVPGRKDQWDTIDLGAPRVALPTETHVAETLLTWDVSRDAGLAGRKLMQKGSAFELKSATGATLGWLQGVNDNFTVRDAGLASPSSKVEFSDPHLKSSAEVRAALGSVPAADQANILALRQALADKAARRGSVALRVSSGVENEPKGSIAGWEIFSDVNNPKFERPAQGELTFSLRMLDANGSASLFAAFRGPASRAGDGWATDDVEVIVSGANVPEVSLGRIDAKVLLRE